MAKTSRDIFIHFDRPTRSIPFFGGDRKWRSVRGKRKGEMEMDPVDCKGKGGGTLSNTVCVSTVADYKVESYLLPTIDDILGPTTKVEGRAAPLHEEFVNIVS